ncbi:hypothetical protein HPG69_012084 [Diceros bicornis minor]|uniref:Uncharacterized protein n=1 Tax=Diceros bicornis minor TaxID=77932 RepID=A0A7J7EJ00_DICBM|nr:hypothetical protein HPG69_012084 [Diceros bicornis minor]
MRQTDGRREPERSGRRQTAREQQSAAPAPRGRQRGPPPGPEGSSRPPTAPPARDPAHRGIGAAAPSV